MMFTLLALGFVALLVGVGYKLITRASRQIADPLDIADEIVDESQFIHSPALGGTALWERFKARKIELQAGEVVELNPYNPASPYYPMMAMAIADVQRSPVPEFSSAPPTCDPSPANDSWGGCSGGNGGGSSQ
jgi:hypothetical protein